jgi:hypothetical protein
MILLVDLLAVINWFARLVEVDTSNEMMVLLSLGWVLRTDGCAMANAPIPENRGRSINPARL